MMEKIPWCYFPDSPVHTQPFFGWTVLAHPVHLVVPPGDLPLRPLYDWEKAGIVEIYRAEEPDEQTVRKWLHEWEQWARTHEGTDLALVGILDSVGSSDGETPSALVGEIRSFLRPKPEWRETPGLRQALVVHLARRLRLVDAECRELLDKVRREERNLKSVMGLSEESEDTVSAENGPPSSGEHDHALIHLLRAWGQILGSVEASCARFVTDDASLFRVVCDSLDCVPIETLTLPLYGELPAGRPPQDLTRDIQAAVAELHAAFSRLADLHAHDDIDAETQGDVSRLLREASESLRRHAESSEASDKPTGELTVRLVLVQRSAFERDLLGLPHVGASTPGPRGNTPRVTVALIEASL